MTTHTKLTFQVSMVLVLPLMLLILHCLTQILIRGRILSTLFSYLVLKFQINRRSERHRNTGHQRLYEFYYLLPFDLWTSYLARILFLRGCGSLFWESPNSIKIFNGL